MAEEVQGGGSELSESFQKVLALINFNKGMEPLLREFEDGTANSMYGVRELRSSLPFIIYFKSPNFDFSPIPPRLLRSCFELEYPSDTKWLDETLFAQLEAKYSSTEFLELLAFVARNEHKTGYRTSEWLDQEIFDYLLALKDELPDAPQEWLELVATSHSNYSADSG